MKKTTKKTLSDLQKIFKGIDRIGLANKLSSSRNVIDQVVCGALRVSAKRAVEIERATNGQIQAKVLRPDIFGE